MSGVYYDIGAIIKTLLKRGVWLSIYDHLSSELSNRIFWKDGDPAITFTISRRGVAVWLAYHEDEHGPPLIHTPLKGHTSVEAQSTATITPEY